MQISVHKIRSNSVKVANKTSKRLLDQQKEAIYDGEYPESSNLLKKSALKFQCIKSV